MYENNNVRMGIRDGFPIGLGYLFISFAVGVFASSLDLSWFEALMISMLNFTSAGEIAAIPVIASGGSLFGMALTQLVINSRYALMSISLSQRLGKSVRLRDRFLLAAFIGDEVFAISCAKESLIGKKYFLSLAILPYIGWSLGTLLGSIVGSVIPTFLASALSISLYAMLITIITQASKASRSTMLCVVSAISLSCLVEFLPMFDDLPSSLMVVILSVVLSAIFALIAPVSEKDPWQEEVAE